MDQEGWQVLSKILLAGLLWVPMKGLRRVFGVEPKDKQVRSSQRASLESADAAAGPSNSRVSPAPAPVSAKPSLPLRIFGKSRSQKQVSGLLQLKEGIVDCPPAHPQRVTWQSAIRI